MIKLVLTDMDGTLLNDNKEMSDEIRTYMHKKYIEEGILFGAASGRQYHNLYSEFKEIQDDVLYIAENGMYIAHGKKELLARTIHQEDVLLYLQIIRSIPNAYPVVCGKDSAYIEDDVPMFLEEAKKYYTMCKTLSSLDEIVNINDKILKIAIWCETNSEQDVYPYFKDYYKKHNFSVSAQKWLDIMPKNMDKGVGVKYLQEYFGITPDETAVFGDYMNDYEMLQCATHSYAMKNAHPKIKEICKFETRYTNNEDGVFKELVHLLGE